MKSEMINQVVVVVTNMGEIVGRVSEETEQYVKLKNPRLFLQQGEKAGFVPGVSAAGSVDPTELKFYKSMIITICDPNPEIENGWQQQTSGIIL